MYALVMYLMQKKMNGIGQIHELSIQLKFED